MFYCDSLEQRFAYKVLCLFTLLSLLTACSQSLRYSFLLEAVQIRLKISLLVVSLMQIVVGRSIACVYSTLSYTARWSVEPLSRPETSPKNSRIRDCTLIHRRCLIRISWSRRHLYETLITISFTSILLLHNIPRASEYYRKSTSPQHIEIWENQCSNQSGCNGPGDVSISS